MWPHPADGKKALSSTSQTLRNAFCLGDAFFCDKRNNNKSRIRQKAKEGTPHEDLQPRLHVKKSNTYQYAD